MTEFLNFFKDEFFPDLVNFFNTIFGETLDINLTYNQLAIIAGLFLVMMFSLMLELVKKVIPFLILLIIIFYFVYGDLSFLDNVFNIFKK